jgi:ribosomal protein S6
LYVVMMFNIEGTKVDAFKARLKLSTNVFRHQFVEASGVETAQEA